MAANGDEMQLIVCEYEFEICSDPDPDPDPDPHPCPEPEPDECQLELDGCVAMAQTMEDFAACDEAWQVCIGEPPPPPPDACQLQLDGCMAMAQTMEEFIACDEAWHVSVIVIELDPRGRRHRGSVRDVDAWCQACLGFTSYSRAGRRAACPARA